MPERSKPLPGRINIVVTKSKSEEIRNNYSDVIVCENFVSSIKKIQEIKHYKAWVIGGKSIYNQALKHHLLDLVYYNIVHPTREMSTFMCDTFVALPKMERHLVSRHGNIELRMGKVYDSEIKYCNLLTDILTNGNMKTGRNGKVLTLFSRHIDLNVEHNFPLLTCKKMFWRGIVEELLFFIRGDTNTKKLEEKKKTFGD